MVKLLVNMGSTPIIIVYHKSYVRRARYIKLDKI